MILHNVGSRRACPSHRVALILPTVFSAEIPSLIIIVYRRAAPRYAMRCCVVFRSSPMNGFDVHRHKQRHQPTDWKCPQIRDVEWLVDFWNGLWPASMSISIQPLATHNALYTNRTNPNGLKAQQANCTHNTTQQHNTPPQAMKRGLTFNISIVCFTVLLRHNKESTRSGDKVIGPLCLEQS